MFMCPEKNKGIYVPPMKSESLTIFEFIGFLTKSALTEMFGMERFKTK